jgi:hypothetical protein
MARGYPDFFGQQSFPGYGVVQRDVDSQAGIAAGATVVVNDIIAKGKILCGQIRCYPVLASDSIELIVTVDDVKIFDYTMSELLYVSHGDSQQILDLKYYGTDKLNYQLFWRVDLTFNRRFTFSVKNNTAGIMSVYSDLCYYLIQED